MARASWLFSAGDRAVVRMARNAARGEESATVSLDVVGVVPTPNPRARLVYADLGVADAGLPAEHGVLALAVGEDEQVAVAGEHEGRGYRGSREDVHAGRWAT